MDSKRIIDSFTSKHIYMGYPKQVSKKSDTDTAIKEIDLKFKCSTSYKQSVVTDFNVTRKL